MIDNRTFDTRVTAVMVMAYRRNRPVTLDKAKIAVRSRMLWPLTHFELTWSHEYQLLVSDTQYK
jgi:hypothetical protein